MPSSHSDSAGATRTSTQTSAVETILTESADTRPPETRSRPAPGRGAMVAGTTAAAMGTFAYRFLTIDFANDHFVHVSRAWQILQGELPIRDFFDPGLFLQYYVSAAALAIWGHNLLGEAIVTSAFIAAGAGLTFLAAARLSRSFFLAAAAAVFSTLSTPRLYSYPKIFFYVLAIVGAWHYARRPGRSSLAILAVITAVAFLFRYDHGVYIGLSAIVLMAITHWGTWRSLAAAIAQYGAAILILLSPYLLYIQLTVGLWPYAISLSPQAAIVSTPQVNWLPITIDRSAPLVRLSPPPDLRVNVRWAPDVDADARRRLEDLHGLTKAERVENSTWSYVLADESRGRLRALIDDPAVADTHGLDRAHAEMDVREPLYIRLQRSLPLLRIHLAPGVFTPENALAWLYYVTLLLPFVCLAVLVVYGVRGATDPRAAAVAGMAIALSIVVVQTLVRGSPDSRLSDVANPICVIAAWVIAYSRYPATPRSRAGQLAWAVAVGALAATTLWSISTYASVPRHLEVGRIVVGPAGMWERAGVVVDRLSERPIDTWEPDDPGVPGLGRYVFECTAPTDRVLVAWFAPQLFFFAERRFAGGQVYLRANWHASPADQRLTIERLERQRVPIVIEHIEGDYRVRFPLVAGYLHEHYRNAPITAERMTSLRVLVDSRITPVGTYAPLGLPCYR